MKILIGTSQSVPSASTVEEGEKLFGVGNTLIREAEMLGLLPPRVDRAAMSAPTIAKSVDDRCPWCRQLVDIDTIPPWWLDHRNLAELYAYMSGSDCPEDDALDPASVHYFLEKPWKWTDERERMLAEKSRAEKSRTEKERTT